MTRIVVSDVTSKLVDAPRAALRTVRHHVAYRQREMPTVDAQRAIKRWWKGRKRFGGSGDLGRMWADGAVIEELATHGLTPESLTRAMFEQIMRGGIWDGWERMVSSGGEFPTGLLPHVERALRLRTDVTTWEVEDTRQPPPKAASWATIDLFDYQKEAVEAFLSSGQGVVNLPPRSGKTRIAIATAAALGVPTVYIAPTVGVVEQTARAFEELLPHKTTIALHSRRLSSSAKTHRLLIRADVIITTPRTALKIPNYHGRQLLILDEFHHAAAKTWKEAAAASGAFYRLGLTGTHFRADGRDMEMAGVLGRAVYARSVGDMVKLGRLVPARIAMLRISGAIRASGYEVYRDGVVEHSPRNRALADAASELVRRGRRVLVLVKEVAHAARLSSMIKGSVAVDGRDNDRVTAMLKALERGEVKAVVGTSVIGEGRDVPAADALVYASGGKSKVRVVQDYFRALTASDGKSSAIVVDAADTQHEILLGHAAERLRHYRGEPAFEASVIDPGAFVRWLDDNR